MILMEAGYEGRCTKDSPLIFSFKRIQVVPNWESK